MKNSKRLRASRIGRIAQTVQVALTLLALTLPQALRAEGSGDDADFDRLDGHGLSGKRVDVVEWEGNLEIHVYPAGSLKGLALKLDKRNKDKPVMVIGYRFENAPAKQLIRRAVLGIELQEPLKVFRDPTESEFDKVVISNNGLSSPLALFKLDPEPRQLYPDGHPALAQKSGDDSQKTRAPASRKTRPLKGDADDGEVSTREISTDDGTIQPFFSRPPLEERNYIHGRGNL